MHKLKLNVYFNRIHQVIVSKNNIFGDVAYLWISG